MNPELIIGRSPYCSIVLLDPIVSREHCSVSMHNNVITVKDLGSKNGTFVNDQKIDKQTNILIGDIIKIGSSILELVESQDTEETLDQRSIASISTTPSENIDPIK
jgi:pSer/pThr/pTyr-binding forkhead associated (FHA) protein